MNELKIFTNSTFGNVRVIKQNRTKRKELMR